MGKLLYICNVEFKTTRIMEATISKRQRTVHPMSYYREMVKDMSDSQKLQLIAILAESIQPDVNSEDADDEEYSLRPFTMEELNARIDQAEAEIPAGLGIPDEEAWDDLEEEFALLEKEKREMAEVL